MMQRTRALTESYLRQTNTIVVVVVPANITRVRDSQAIQLVQSHKKEKVAIGVLAKADLAHDPRYKQRKRNSPYWELEDRLQGKVDDIVSLEHGWIAVKNRDTLVAEEEASDLTQSTRAEEKWFEEETQLGQDVRNKKCGLPALVAKVGEQIDEHVKSPGGWKDQQLSHIKDQTANIDATMKSLGAPPCSLTTVEVLDEVAKCLESALRPVEKAIVKASDLNLCGISTEDSELQRSIIKRLQCRESLKNELVREKVQEDKIFTTTKEAMEKAIIDDVFKASVSGVRLCRFETLRSFVVEAIKNKLDLLHPEFNEYATNYINDFFVSNLTGCEMQSIRCDPASNVSKKVLGYNLTRLQNAIAELAVQHLVMPLLDLKTVILEFIERSAGNHKKKNSKKRTRDESSSSTSSSCTSLEHEGQCRQLLKETCADQRSELAKQKHLLFVASKKVEGL